MKKLLQLLFTSAFLVLMSATTHVTMAYITIGDSCRVRFDNLQTTFYDTIVFCNTTCSMITLYAPAAAINNKQFLIPGVGFFNDVDSVVVTTDQTVSFQSDETGQQRVIVRFVSPIPGFALNDVFVCPGASTTLTLPPNPYGSYYWGNDTMWFPNDTMQSFTVVTTGIYFAAVTNSCGMTTTSSEVSNYPVTPVSLGADTAICAFTTLTLDAGNATSYDWSNGSTTQQISVGGGTYSVTTTDSNGCHSSDTIVISETQLRTLSNCLISYNPYLGFNQPAWFINPVEQEITHVKTFGNNNVGVFILLGTTPYNQGTFVDSSWNADTHERAYTTVAVTGCGDGPNGDTLGSLRIYVHQSDIQWQAPLMVSGPPSFYIVKALHSDSSITIIDTVAQCLGSGCFNSVTISYDPTVVKYFVVYLTSCTTNKMESTGDSSYAMSNYISASTITWTQEQKLNDILVYPNPASEFLKIKVGDAPIQVELLNSLGQTILKTNKKNLDVSDIPNGIYLIILTTGDRKITNKLTIIH